MITLLAAVLVRPTYPVQHGTWDRTHIVPFEAFSKLTRDELSATDALRGGRSEVAYAIFSQILLRNPEDLVAEKGSVEAAELCDKLAAHRILLERLSSRSRKDQPSVGLAYGFAEWALATINGPVAENPFGIKNNPTANSYLQRLKLLPSGRHSDLPLAILFASLDGDSGKTAMQWVLNSSAQKSAEVEIYAVRFVSARPSQIVAADGTLEPVPAYRKPDYPLVLKTCDRIISQAPAYSLPYFLSARILSYLGQKDRAIQRMREFVRLSPPNEDRYLPMAKRFLEKPEPSSFSYALPPNNHVNVPPGGHLHINGG